MKTFTIREGVYDIDLVVVYNCSLEDLEKYLKKKFNHKLTEDHSAADALAIEMLKRNETIIWLEKYENNAYWVGTLIHELLHIVYTELNYCKIKLCDETEEVFAYLQEYLFKECYKKLNKSLVNSKD